MSNQTSSWICPRRRALLFLVAPVILAGCTGTSRAVGSPRSSASPTGRATPTVSAIAGTPSPSASTSAATPSLAAAVVLSSWFSSPTYAISLVGGAGRVLASATATSPTIGILQVPTPTSESNTRVYYLDGNTTVRYLAPDGSTGVAAQVSAPSGSVVEFAVSPDDTRIAISIQSFSDATSTFTETSYVEDVGTGADQVQLPGVTCYVPNGQGIDASPPPGTCSGLAEQPTGWHDGYIVYILESDAPAPAEITGWLDQAGYLLVDPNTGATVATLCTAQNETAKFFHSPPPSAAGFLCSVSGPSSTDVQLQSWSGTVVSDLGSHNPPCMDVASVSPGGKVAFEDNSAGCGLPHTPVVVPAGGHQTAIPYAGYSVGWLDDDHLIVTPPNSSGGLDTLGVLRILDVNAGQLSPPLAAEGFYAGAVPTLLH